MDELSSQSSMIKAEALRMGFDGCGISKAGKLKEDSDRLSDWLHKGFHGSMKYMENHFEKRTDPVKLFDGAKSVISVILNYFPSAHQEDPDAPVVSKYAYGKDYHQVIRKMLRKLLVFINENTGPVKGRGFVDSAPVLDRAWAARSGLGWIGKNTNLISPSKGSFFFIGSLIVDRELFYDRPIPDFCGDCTRCINACPTQAIIAPRLIDSRKCISYHTIENKGEIDPELKDKFMNRVFGCDICQDVCPWNRKAVTHQVEEFNPLDGLLEMKKKEWYGLSEEDFKVRFKQSPIKRTGYAGFIRNLRFLLL